MKITNEYLKKIIKEEINLLKEEENNLPYEIIQTLKFANDAINKMYARDRTKIDSSNPLNLEKSIQNVKEAKVVPTLISQAYQRYIAMIKDQKIPEEQKISLLNLAGEKINRYVEDNLRSLYTFYISKNPLH